MHFPRLANTLLKDEESTHYAHIFACNFAKYSPILKIFSQSDSAIKNFLHLVLTNAPHVKYADALPCNLSLMACFADINVSQCSVATYAIKVRLDF